jgi:hypothetical protein
MDKRQIWREGAKQEYLQRQKRIHENMRIENERIRLQENENNYNSPLFGNYRLINEYKQQVADMNKRLKNESDPQVHEALLKRIEDLNEIISKTELNPDNLSESQKLLDENMHIKKDLEENHYNNPRIRDFRERVINITKQIETESDPQVRKALLKEREELIDRIYDMKPDPIVSARLEQQNEERKEEFRLPLLELKRNERYRDFDEDGRLKPDEPTLEQSKARSLIRREKTKTRSNRIKLWGSRRNAMRQKDIFNRRFPELNEYEKIDNPSEDEPSEDEPSGGRKKRNTRKIKKYGKTRNTRKIKKYRKKRKTRNTRKIKKM